MKNIGTKNIRAHIMMGLPGSGKTYYAKAIAKDIQGSLVIHFDDYANSGKSIKDVIKDEVAKIINETGQFITAIIFDGPWFTKKAVYDLLAQAKEALEEQYENPKHNSSANFKINDLRIVHYEEDREMCMINDKDRREKSAAADIRNIPYDGNLNEDFRKEVNKILNLGRYNLYIENKEVCNYKHFGDVTGVYDFDRATLRSEKWAVAGHWGNCWGDEGDINPEPPLEFKEFDDMLLKMCPNISFLVYKKLYNECCKIEEDEDVGYYGTWTEYNYWECDLNKLYKLMVEMKLITEKED